MIKGKTKFGGIFCVEATRNGEVLWFDTAYNMVVAAGLNHILDVVFCSGTQITTWYVGLLSATPTIIAGNTLDTHAGWTEFTNVGTNRVSWGMTRTNQTVANAAAISFTVNADNQSVGGAYICSVLNGTTGVLLCAAAFTGGNKTGLMTNDVLNVTYSFEAADDGV